jgi:hypothetical protein
MRGAPIQRSYHRRALLGFILLVIAGLSPLVIPSPARAMPVPGSSVTIVGNPPSRPRRATGAA